MDEIRHEAFIKTGHSFVPPCLLDAVPGALVGVVLVLEARPDDLIRVGGGGCDELRHGGEGQVFRSRLKEKQKVEADITKAGSRGGRVITTTKPGRTKLNCDCDVPNQRHALIRRNALSNLVHDDS